MGFLIKKKLAHSIEEIKGISERIAVLNITLPLNKNEKWSIIQAYSPTESDKKDDIIKIEKCAKYGHGKRSKNGDRLVTFAI